MYLYLQFFFSMNEIMNVQLLSCKEVVLEVVTINVTSNQKKNFQLVLVFCWLIDVSSPFYNSVMVVNEGKGCKWNPPMEPPHLDKLLLRKKGKRTRQNWRIQINPGGHFCFVFAKQILLSWKHKIRKEEPRTKITTRSTFDRPSS